LSITVLKIYICI